MSPNLASTIDEIAPDTWRISVAMPPDFIPGGFSFNQYLIVDERPLLFHTGPKKLFGLVSAQIRKVMPLADLRYIAFSHVEADECGALPEFLAAAPLARPVCSEVAAMVSVRDLVDVEPIAMADGQVLDLGRHRVQWQYTPHVPHGWDAGYLFDQTARTLFNGDLFTQPGTGDKPLVSDDLVGPCDAFRREMDYFSHGANTQAMIEKLASLRPETLACMHGSAWTGDGAAMLRRLGESLLH